MADAKGHGGVRLVRTSNGQGRPEVVRTSVERGSIPRVAALSVSNTEELS